MRLIRESEESDVAETLTSQLEQNEKLAKLNEEKAAIEAAGRIRKLQEAETKEGAQAIERAVAELEKAREAEKKSISDALKRLLKASRGGKVSDGFLSEIERAIKELGSDGSTEVARRLSSSVANSKHAPQDVREIGHKLSDRIRVLEELVSRSPGQVIENPPVDVAPIRTAQREGADNVRSVIEQIAVDSRSTTEELVGAVKSGLQELLADRSRQRSQIRELPDEVEKVKNWHRNSRR